MSAIKLQHYMTIQEAAEQTRLSYYYIRQLCLNESIKYIKSGAKYLLNEDSLMCYLASEENSHGKH